METTLGELIKAINQARALGASEESSIYIFKSKNAKECQSVKVIDFNKNTNETVIEFF